MKDPAMLFYTSDFLTGVLLLSMYERGQYITLICLQQQAGHLSLEQMQKAVGKVSPAVLEKYVQDENGLYYNVRAEKEINRRLKHSQKQTENINKRWNKNTTDVPNEYHGITEEIPNEYHGITNEDTVVIPLETETEIITTTLDDRPSKTDVEFNNFWSIYPKKVGKKAAYSAFKKVPKSEYPKIVPAVQQQIHSTQWQKGYIPNPSTWLNQGRWDDEVDNGNNQFDGRDNSQKWNITYS